MRATPLIFMVAIALAAQAHETRVAAAPVEMQVSAPALAELKFREFYALPIGPRGLVPSAKLLSLNGKRVHIVGYMAQQEAPTPGVLIATPLPVALGDEDESLVDDLPATTLYVQLNAAQSTLALPFMPGLLRLTGVLRVGPHREADGRLSYVRLELDADLSSALAEATHSSKGQTP